MPSVPVTVDNFPTVETAFQFQRTIGLSGGVNRFFRQRVPTQVDQQPVIRMQRDTLYAAGVVDVSAGADLVVPDAGDRYLSVAVINEHHYTNALIHEPGTHRLDKARFDTDHVQVVVRILADPNDEEDLAVAHALQDQISVDAASDRPFELPDVDKAEYDRLYGLLLDLGSHVPDAIGAFGSRDEVEPVRFLVNTATGWGGLNEREAVYQSVMTQRPVGHYRIHLGDVPADEFWSLSVYNRDGYFEANPYGSHNLSSVTATPSEDGSVTIDLAPEDTGDPNFVYVMDGWNYVFRLYKPHQSVIDGGWWVPDPIPVD